MQWSGLQSLLEHAESDVLILLDCCAAASSISSAGSGVTEVIAACGFETGAPGVGDHSFTRSLIDELRYWGQGHTLSVAMLHNKVLSRLKYWKPRFGTTGEHEHRKTPIYIVLANEGKQRSIALIPLSPAKPPAVELAAASFSKSSSSDTSMESQLDIHGNTQNSSQSSLDQIWPDLKFHCPKVLMSIALEEDQMLHTAGWVDWLRSVPAMVKYAHVEGIFKSGSTMMLLSIPVAIWDLLPKNPAMMFIAFIHSQNLLRNSPPTLVAPWDAVKENTTTPSRIDDLTGDSEDAVEKNTMVFSGVEDPEDNLSQLQNIKKFKEEEPDTRTSLMTRGISESDSKNKADESLGVPPNQTSSTPLFDAAPRHQVDDVEASTLREVGTVKQTTFKDIDVEEWLGQTHSDDEIGDPPQDPVSWSTRTRVSSAGALLLTRANLERLVATRADSVMPCPEMLISEGSRSGTEEDDEHEVASLASSLPFSMVMQKAVNERPGNAEPGVYDELPNQPPLYRARPWQGPLYDSSDPGVKLQPETSDAAIMRYRKRTEDVENMSHAATWGSRHTSEDDLHGRLHQLKIGEELRDRILAEPVPTLTTSESTACSIPWPLTPTRKGMGPGAEYVITISFGGNADRFQSPTCPQIGISIQVRRNRTFQRR